MSYFAPWENTNYIFQAWEWNFLFSFSLRKNGIVYLFHRSIHIICCFPFFYFPRVWLFLLWKRKMNNIKLLSFTILRLLFCLHHYWILGRIQPVSYDLCFSPTGRPPRQTGAWENLLWNTVRIFLEETFLIKYFIIVCEMFFKSCTRYHSLVCPADLMRSYTLLDWKQWVKVFRNH